jgi:hypothetical protein
MFKFINNNINSYLLKIKNEITSRLSRAMPSLASRLQIVGALACLKPAGVDFKPAQNGRLGCLHQRIDYQT